MPYGLPSKAFFGLLKKPGPKKNRAKILPKTWFSIICSLAQKVLIVNVIGLYAPPIGHVPQPKD